MINFHFITWHYTTAHLFPKREQNVKNLWACLYVIKSVISNVYNVRYTLCQITHSVPPEKDRREKYNLKYVFWQWFSILPLYTHTHTFCPRAMSPYVLRSIRSVCVLYPLRNLWEKKSIKSFIETWRKKYA